MNKGLNNEKILSWNFKRGFESEDSDDELTSFDRFERRFYEKRRIKHGNEKIYLQSRKLMPFERLLLKLGGDEIFANVLAKQITLTP